MVSTSSNDNLKKELKRIKKTKTSRILFQDQIEMLAELLDQDQLKIQYIIIYIYTFKS
jgi:hypothetical protein